MHFPNIVVPKPILFKEPKKILKFYSTFFRYGTYKTIFTYKTFN